MTNATKPNDGERDLAILYPDQTETVAGIAVTMREYTFGESMKHYALIGALTDAITGIALTGEFRDLDSLRSAFGDNSDAVMQLIAIACDQPVAWVQGLGADDGEHLQLLWWGVNADFFLRRVLLSVQLRKVRELGGPTFSVPSPLPATGTRETLPGTPSVN